MQARKCAPGQATGMQFNIATSAMSSACLMAVITAGGTRDVASAPNSPIQNAAPFAIVMPDSRGLAQLRPVTIRRGRCCQRDARSVMVQYK